MTKKILLLLLFLTGCWTLSAQEHLSGLQANPLLSKSKNIGLQPRALTGEVHLPFLDDFSYFDTGVYPVDSLWADRYTFVNSTYCVNPPTVGVVTLDALNDTGAMYPYAVITPFIADSLSSQRIRLDSLFSGVPSRITPADSLYFSFYYQPQGLGDAPNKLDSLMLDFYSPHLNKWISKWGSPGMTLDSFHYKFNRDFRQVMIPIKDTTFLQKGFRFRFTNYASIAATSLPSWQSNMDEWNLDYVYLNVGRSKNDTVYKDITFVNPAPSMLKNFSQMPVRHFANTDLTDKFHLKISNLNNILDNKSYKYIVTQENGPYTFLHDAGVSDLLPFITNGLDTYDLHVNPAVNFTLPSLAGMDSVVFDVAHIIGSNGWTENILRNDTITRRQEFNNAYAYDDGTAEKGYGLSGVNAKLAYEFTFNQPDTLGGIQMYFNQTLSTPYYKYFKLTVWSSLNPETVIYQSSQKRPEFADSINAFYTYEIKDTAITLSGTFYVGWVQTTEDNLNVGYDQNTNAQSHTFYNAEGVWQPTSFNGALMIRPLVGTTWQKTKIAPVEGHPADHFVCNVGPNPANGLLNLMLPINYNTELDRANITVEMFDFIGRKVFSQAFADQINVGTLSQGAYYMRLTNYHANEVFVYKVIISR